MFINITGIDGCGKTTQVEKVSKRLLSLGKDVFLSKAYGKKEKEKFEDLLPSLDQVSILFLFQFLHTQQRIHALRALRDNKIVISDRWDDSYLSYHMSFGILSKDKFLREYINNLAFDYIVPDVTFLLDISASKASQRMELRKKSFFDRESLENFSILRDALLLLAKEKEWVVIDATQPIDDISDSIWFHLLKIGPFL